MRPGASPQSRRYVFTGSGEVSSLVTDLPGTPVTLPVLLILIERERKEERKREKFYIYSDVTHTHPTGAGSTLKGKRKKRADTKDGPTTKQRRGGRGTDRPPEPTYTAKRT